MAIDRYLLDQSIQNNIPSTIRFYTWSKPTISLGYHQHKYPPHWHDVIWQNQPLDLIKRPTGGRAVLHQGDLTYSMITGDFTGKRLVVYQQICEFLIRGWQSLGVELKYGTVGKDYAHNPNCFGTATAADLVLDNGYKMIGSAQLIKEGRILQHGSMKLSPDRALFEQVFGEFIPSPIEGNLPIEVIIEALTEAVMNTFNIDLQVLPFSDREWAEIRKIAQDWNYLKTPV
jgi:lipoate-protein ligase A